MMGAATDQEGGLATIAPASDTGIKRKKKFTGGNASKRHRDRVNIEFNNLAKLLPFSENVIGKLDKSSILRLAVSYIRAKSFFQGSDNNQEKEQNPPSSPISSSTVNSTTTEVTKPCIKEGTGLLSDIFSNALDGFLLVLTEDMKVLYVSESVRDHLGYCQAGIIHENFLQFVNSNDHNVIHWNIAYLKNERDNKKENILDETQNFSNRHSFSNGQANHHIDQDDKAGVVQRRFVCQMKCAFSCSSRFYTAYRSFQFSGYLRRCTIQEGREQKHLNTLVLCASPSKNGIRQSIDIVPEIDDKIMTMAHGERMDYLAYDQRYSAGFRIEPTLRPHIAPIPVSTCEATADRASPPQPKPRQLPLLIPAAEVRSKEHFMMSQNIPIPRMYAAPSSSTNDSRYSDYSDDSKCSPASSPNLMWKRSRSPQIVNAFNNRSDVHKINPYEYYSTRENEGYRMPSLLEKDCHIAQHGMSADHHTVDTHTLTRQHSNVPDVYVGATMLMKLRNNSESPPKLPTSFETNEQRKRTIDNHYRQITPPPKRLKSPTNGFHISSLLGLEERQKLDQYSNLQHTMDDVDVCKIDKKEQRNESDKRVLYDDIFYKMSKNLDYTFHKTMSVNNWHLS